MGNGNSSYISELSDDESTDSEFDYSLESRSNKKVTCNVASNKMDINQKIDADVDCVDTTTDASADSFPKPELALSLDSVLEIEKNLDNYEIVSLVYLLYEEPNVALQDLILLLEGAKKNPLYTWASLQESRNNAWQKKMVEVLSIIKNYQVLRTLGYKKEDVYSYYLPHFPNGITSINKVKKAIYIICEKLNREKTEKFLEIVKLHFEEKGMIFPNYDTEYLELYFLDWETKGYISMTDLSNIKRALKVMEEEALHDIVESISNSNKERVQRKQTDDIQIAASNKIETRKPISRGLSTSTDTHQRASNSREDSEYFRSSLPSISGDTGLDFKDSNRYDIDPENPGVLLIINQEEFYTEIDEKFLDLLPMDIKYNKLEQRTGTEKDKMDLANTFKKFGFRVIIKDNLTHEELIAEVEYVVKGILNESSLFVCILSHGDKGVVYGANSCMVKVSKIQDIMCKTNKKHLMGKPKILILQSCQGKICQRLNEDDDEYLVTTDGPSNSKQSVPSTVDMLTFWATVPGYAAIRNKRTGSWFIQALCTSMAELGNKYHFADICTRINNNVSSQTWKVEVDENTMTPMIVSTLRKDFHLPPMKIT